MTSEPTLEEAICEWAAEPDDDDRTVALVAEHGEYDADELDCFEVDCNGETRYYHAHRDLPDDVHHTVKQFVREYDPGAKQCFANAAELCRFDERFDYVEGVTASEETSRVHDHAWNEVGGLPVDVTRGSAERFGVQIDNDDARAALPAMERENRWDVLENPHVPDEMFQ